MCSSLLLFACFSLTIFLFNVDLDLEFDFELKLSNDLLVFLEYMFYKVLLRHNLVLCFIICELLSLTRAMLACVPVIIIVAEEAHKIVYVYNHCIVRFPSSLLCQ